MTFCLVVEDRFGPPFLKKLFKKKSDEGLFSVRPKKIIKSAIRNKMKRVVNAALLGVDRVIILMDADGQPHDQKINEIRRYLDARNLEQIDIVLLDYEIEEWICYSQEISIISDKPSKILRRTHNYRKNRLPQFAEKLDCQKLTNCPSFRRLTNAINLQ